MKLFLSGKSSLQGLIQLVFVIVFIFIAIWIGFAYLSYPDVRDAYIQRLNNCAKQVNINLKETVSELNPIINNDTIFYGEYANSYMLIYGNSYIGSENLYLYGEEPDTIHFFWAARISKEGILEIWCSEHPIAEYELHTYSYEQQRDSTYFITPFTSPRKWAMEGWIDDSMVVGYISNN